MKKKPIKPIIINRCARCKIHFEANIIVKDDIIEVICRCCDTTNLYELKGDHKCKTTTIP